MAGPTKSAQQLGKALNRAHDHQVIREAIRAAYRSGLSDGRTNSVQSSDDVADKLIKDRGISLIVDK